MLAIARSIVGRNETGVGRNRRLPFHRVEDTTPDFVTYPTVNSGLKDDGELQGLLREWIATHGLRGGGAKDMESALGGRTIQAFGNWRSACYR